MSDCWVYAGLAGDTDPGRFVSAGLYRSRNGVEVWENLSSRFETAPQVRAILTNPLDPTDVIIGAQDGVWRSKDSGESWRRLSAPKPELSVWSLFRHPKDNQTLFAGYEPCSIYRSMDDGQTWGALPIEARFPEITLAPEAFPKRVLSLSIDPTDANLIYAAVEIGGLLRSEDGGSSWEAAIDGVYVTEDSVDVHSVVTDPTAPGTVTIATRVGVFKSENRGRRWRHLGVPKLRPQGSYCRFLAQSPDDPRTSMETRARSLSRTTAVQHGRCWTWACRSRRLCLRSPFTPTAQTIFSARQKLVKSFIRAIVERRGQSMPFLLELVTFFRWPSDDLRTLGRGEG
jgi:hypothetical protein